ncbi:PREDICTED: alpha-1-macroglobulin-like isoform X1 [Nicrophorus vespilloides]|uniref:Alpha-1-macroglobulin-like isoform X1 n=1 Tax=Nicrophorus vespilloides TaxID=110193 RepID=A0ABM1NET2_NICVS|nr:PREDICTED: alpha-1-macroglobulin-like isoform X1 [Nicrophorus vespilloides]
MYLFNFTLFILTFGVYSAEISDLKLRVPGYMLSHANTFLAGKNETVCVTLYDAQLPVKMLLDLKIKDKHNVFTKLITSDYYCFDVQVPSHTSTEVLTASLHLQLQLNGTIYASHNQDAVLIYPNTDVTFIETDRNIYKQGDVVKLRLLVLSHDLKSTNQRNISNIKIINPKGFIVSLWRKVNLLLGFVQLEHQLTDDAILGKWSVEVNGILKYFMVKRFTLPRFKVEITAPKSIYANSVEDYKFFVCAKYTFKKPVKGVSLMKISYPDGSLNATSRIAWLYNGCAEYKFNKIDLKFSTFTNSHRVNWALKITSTVTEYGTNQIESETIGIQVKSYKYKLQFSKERTYFQPGLPYYGKVKATESYVDLKKETVKICYQVAIKKPWNLKPEQCGFFKFNEDGIVLFTILPMKENAVEISLSAKSLESEDNCLSDSLKLNRWYSLSNSYMLIERDTKVFSKCGSMQHYAVYFTSNKLRNNETLTFYYMLKSKNGIAELKSTKHTVKKQTINFKNELKNIVGAETKFNKVENSIDKCVLKFRLPKTVSARFTLIVYYITKEEVVSNNIDILFDKCLPNEVNTSWSEDNVYPGESTTLSIDATSFSLCAISAVDLATSPKSLNIQNIFQPFMHTKESLPKHKPNCLSSIKRKQDKIPEQLFELRKRRSIISLVSNDYDSYEAFQKADLSIITNMNVISKPCNLEPDIFPRLLSLPNSYEIFNEDRGVSVRSEFPESWLWELIPTNSTGQVKVIREVPHSITTWVFNSICISPTDGIGLGPTQEITVFKPFFIDILLPYSIKRGETFYMQVSIHNYMNFSLPITVTLPSSNRLQLLQKPELMKVSICVKSNDIHTHVFIVKGISLGKINVTVLAETDSSYPRECGPETIISKNDIVVKPLLVEPEGYQSEFSKSVFICGKDQLNNVSWDVVIPKDRISDSTNTKLIFNSDLLGPTIQNLERIINIPTGCGEQIISVMAPNLYIMKYLKANNKLSQALKQRMVKNIKMGYQKILSYVHEDGSFSAFGYHDSLGSMFLSAFVVRTLQQAKEYTYVDENIIRRASKWIIEKQLENGCFPAVSHVFQDMGGTSMENSTAALTAYVVISLLESGIEIPQSVKTNALYCIRGQYYADKYTVALCSYALYLLKWKSEADRYVKKLVELATSDDKMMWWNVETGSSSTNIETTAYALFSLLESKNNDNLIYASQIVRWLSTQRRSSGSFVTTQDTSVALDALSRYGSFMKEKEANLTIKIINGDQHLYNININTADGMKTKEINMNAVPENLKLQASGSGCVLAQLSVTYNVKQVETSEAFKLQVDVAPVSTIDKCSIRIISPCISFLGTGHSNMAVLEVNMPSGFEADRASLHKLTDDFSSKVKKFEEFEDKVVLYFTELTNDLVCVPFNINENIIIDNRVNTTAKIYDYYRPEFITFMSYHLNTCEFSDVLENPVEKSSPIIKRNTKHNKSNKSKYGLNTDFVNVDIEMQPPAGIEGNIPAYVKTN